MQKFNSGFILIVMFLLSAYAPIQAQEKNNSTFIVKGNNTSTDLNAYIKAMEKADFKCYHLSKTRRTLKFDTGVTVELFSIAEMLANHTNVNSPCQIDESKLNQKAPVYQLTESGFIAEKHDDVNIYQKH
jgi:hypothetical protein